jgi:hypothetical protein
MVSSPESSLELNGIGDRPAEYKVKITQALIIDICRLFKGISKL